MAASNDQERSDVLAPITDEMLADPRWRRFHLFVKYAILACGLVMVVEGAFFFPYILFRFGWGGS